jgi:hypothetical protein
MSIADQVYTGPWVNYSIGRVTGATLTLSGRDSGFLVAFLALFVAVTGGRCWAVTRYVVHQLRARELSRDALYHQHQNTLRNNQTAAGALWELMRTTYFWRRLRWSAVLRAAPLLLLAFLNVAVFGAAGILSSQVTKAAGGDLLLKGNTCGYVAVPTKDEDILKDRQVALVASANQSAQAIQYAANCYSADNGGGNAFSCNNYVVQNLPYTTNLNATCPFESGTCLFGDTAAVQFDTGYIDSSSALGMNAKFENRVLYRQVTTCAPLVLKKFEKLINVTDDEEDLNVYAGSDFGYNDTFSYDIHQALDLSDYTVDTIWSLAKYNLSWEVAPALNRTDADVSMFFISANALTYTDPVDDPIFAAHIPSVYTNDKTGHNTTVYISDHYVTLLGCAEQYQFCNPQLNRSGLPEDCTLLQGNSEEDNFLDDIDFNNIQYNTASVINDRAQSGMYLVVQNRGSSVLLAHNYIYQEVSIGLPEDQWQRELRSWFETSLAEVQVTVASIAIGVPSSVPAEFVFFPDICYPQMIRGVAGFQNFSIVGLVVILAIGGVIICLGISLEPLVTFINRKSRSRAGQYARLQWVLDGKFQLQRMAFEGAGWNGWDDTSHRHIPVRFEGGTLGTMDISNVRHPRIAGPGFTPLMEVYHDQKGFTETYMHSPEQ